MAKEQQQQQVPAMVDDDFDNLSLFVSGSGSSSLRSFNLNTTDSSSTLSGLQGEPESPEDLEDTEAQQVCGRGHVTGPYFCHFKTIYWLKYLLSYQLNFHHQNR